MSRIEQDILMYTPAELSDTTAAAMASIHMEKRAREQQGYATLAMIGSVGATTGVFGKVNHAAKLFCIAFAMIAPNLLFIKYVL